MNLCRSWPALMLAAALCACATATPYQPLERGVGYSEQKLEDSRYRVQFEGNSSTPRQTVENYVLYRAAELTLGGGYDYFTLQSASAGAQARRSGPSIGFGVGGFSLGSHGGFGVGIGTGSDGRDTEYEGSAIVTLHRGPKPVDDATAYDARALQSNLESSIVRPPD